MIENMNENKIMKKNKEIAGSNLNKFKSSIEYILFIKNLMSKNYGNETIFFHDENEISFHSNKVYNENNPGYLVTVSIDKNNMNLGRIFLPYGKSSSKDEFIKRANEANSIFKNTKVFIGVIENLTEEARVIESYFSIPNNYHDETELKNSFEISVRNIIECCNFMGNI